MKPMQQHYDLYTPEDFEVWKILFERQMTILSEVSSKEYLKGIEDIHFSAEKIPDFTKVNRLLGELTGWGLVVVPGIIPEKDFFPLLAQKRFPATTWLRKKSQLDYLEEPDMFHDVFGHAPLLTNRHFCDFFEHLGHIGIKHLGNEKIISMLGSVYWFTVEFGMIREDDKLKIYGAGILSSHGETKYCLTDVPKHFDYEAEKIMNTLFRTDVFQDKYFVIKSFEELYHSIDVIEKVADAATVMG